MTKKYFYFSEADRKLRFGDNRLIELNTTHTVEGKLKLCRNGLHASERLIDALKYAPGAILWLVELGDEKLIGNDKVCSRSRKYLAEFDATDLLREFARKQAMINIELIKPYCSEEDYALIVKYLETGDEKLRKAAESVALAAYSAARSVAESVARSAARSAAYSTAWDAESAARSAAESAAESAAWAAESAVDSAADSATRSAAESVANDMLVDMIREATRWEI